MFTIDSSLAAEIDYRTNRIRDTWAPRRRRITLPRVPRRLHVVGPRPGSVGTVATAR